MIPFNLSQVSCCCRMAGTFRCIQCGNLDTRYKFNPVTKTMWEYQVGTPVRRKRLEDVRKERTQN